MSRLDERNGLYSRPYWLSLCIVLLCIAAILRFSHLGDEDFGLDEILHVYAAEQLLQGNPPVLPSGYVYSRSASYSYLVALAGFLGKFDEFTLRVPSVVFGILVVLLVYGITTRWFSASAGLAAAFLTTFSPIEIAFSREVRMYTLFQLLFLLILFFFYEGFETYSPTIAKKTRFPQIRKWVVAFNIRPLFLLVAGITFLLAWDVHTLVQPGISGPIAYVLVMAGIALVINKLEAPIRQKYIASSVVIILGGVAVSALFPEKLSKLMAITQLVPDWYQERADNWSYYRWILLDEYPIVFGSLTMFLIVCLVKNPKVGLFLSVSFLVPVILHSVIFPLKSYRYIFHVLPLMYIAAGVGFSECLSFLWSAGCKFNTKEYLPKMVWNALVAGILCTAVLGMLINMPWFMRTVKDYSNDFHLPHFVDVQHHKWKNAMKYISQHQTDGDVIVSGYPLLCRHYGASQPLYFMNNAYLRLNVQRNLKNNHGELIDYTFGAVVLKNLDDFKQVVNTHPSGWAVTYRWRDERYWNHPDRPISIFGTFPDEVVRYLQDHYDFEEVPGAPDMALWRWGKGRNLRS